nr:MAG TPA: hypothetical protein [Caudoviricetes sp.]
MLNPFAYSHMENLLCIFYYTFFAKICQIQLTKI